MKQHLFKGIRVDNGKWVEGYYIYDESGQTTEEPTAYICHLNTHPCGWSLIPYEVIPESISEYTGIHDKNGKKIFENDIVRTQPFYDRPFSSQRKGKQFVGVVEYTTRKFNGNRFYPEQIYDARWRVNIAEDIGKYVHSSWSDFWDCEVIGNMFENSELLEGNNDV
jgi:uncharacterized phage protein (TIGR01671 family)